jgi:hypothetical protein
MLTVTLFVVVPPAPSLMLWLITTGPLTLSAGVKARCRRR